jgi:hypothetical protein
MFDKSKYNEVEDFSEALAVVELNGKYSYIDKTGKAEKERLITN